MLGSEGVKQLQEQNPEVFKTPEVANTTPDNITEDNAVLNMQIANVLGLASLETSRYAQEIKDAVEWAKSNGAKTIEDILYEIKYLVNRLGNNPNEKKVKSISRYIFLSNERNRIAKELERMQIQ